MSKIQHLKTKIFADGANLESIKELYGQEEIKGFTTNPTLMRKAGILDYKTFALDVLSIVKDLPVSFEVFADDLLGMEKQALEIASWGANVVVKIPITNTKGESTVSLVKKLSSLGVACNITAICNLEQFIPVLDVLDKNTPAILSIFAGRIADTGVDPVPLMKKAVELAKSKPKTEVLWASPRELLNIFQADEVGCHIITVTYDLLKKLAFVGKDLNEYSLETVEMFYKDAQSAGYTIDTSIPPTFSRETIEILRLNGSDFYDCDIATEKYVGETSRALNSQIEFLKE
jgi:transaldolase